MARRAIVPFGLCIWALAELSCGGSGTNSTGTGGAGTGGHTSTSSTTASSTGSGGASTSSTSGSGGASTSSTTASSSSSGTGGGTTGEGPDVLQRNKHPSRDGHYVDTAMTPTAAAAMARDPSFNATVQGNVYAQPLYVANGPGGQGALYVVTESDNVYALSEKDGSVLWTQSMGTAAAQTGAGCGNVLPLGITGTPIIDLPSRTMFLDAAIGNANTIQKHMVHALSIDDGSEKPGFPVDVSTVTSNGVTLNPVVQNERGALALVNGTLYVPYGGHFGDCGAYRGWVVGIPVENPAATTGFVTGAKGGGMWAPGGVASDGTDVFVATGNTFGANTWSHGEAILRLHAGPVFSGQATDYFAPANWLALDNGDIDIGGSGPLLVDLPGATPSKLVVSLGKNGVAYVLDRGNLGGIAANTANDGIAHAQLTTGRIINAAATYPIAGGAVVVMHSSANGSSCPAGTNGDLIAMKIDAASPPTISTLWCAGANGRGSPIATTTDGQNNPIVWIAGAEGSQRLHGYDGLTGAPVFGGGGAADLMPNQVRRFQSPIVVKGRIFVAADGALYAFKSP